MNHQVDFCIIGAGIAGLSLADALSDHDLSTLVLDKQSIASGASGTPGGLVNPATGRRAKKSWKAEECYMAISKNIKKVAAGSEEKFHVAEGLLRPALLEKMARKMKKQYDSTTWPERWCQWKTEEEIKEIHPGINCVDGGLWLPVGLAVDVEKYLQAYADYLKEKGSRFLLNRKPRNFHQEKGWVINLADSTVRAKHIVFATGQNTTKFNYWSWLPINLIKGQVAKFKKTGNPLSFDYSISSLGYMARLDDPHTFIQGSTYEHDFDHLDPDKEGEQYLRKRLRRTLPQLEKEVITVDQWAGVRTSTPNYKPILGEHPEYKNMHIFSALGSKGLLYGKFLAEHYADHLTAGTPLYPDIDIARFEYKGE